MKHGENNHGTNHSLRNLCVKLDTSKNIDWLISTCKKVGVVNLQLDGSPIAGKKSSFLGKVEFNTKASSLLNVLKNTVTILWKRRGDMKLFSVVLWGPNVQKTEGLWYRSYQSFHDTNKWTLDFQYYLLFVYMKILICLSMSSVITWHSMKL